MKSFLKIHVFPLLIYIIFRLLWWTWKVKLIEPIEMKSRLINKQPFLMAHWHGDEIVLMCLISRYRLATITSTSEDGELMTRVIRRLGGVVSRGSSTRGGASALRGLLRFLKSGEYNSSFAVDGPKGPIYKVKPGIFEVSRLTETPIFWAGVSADRFFRFEKSWNKTILPKPFSNVFIEWHGIMNPVTREEDPKSSVLSFELEKRLNAAKFDASQYFNSSN